MGAPGFSFHNPGLQRPHSAIRERMMPAYFTIKSFLTDVTPLTLLEI